MLQRVVIHICKVTGSINVYKMSNFVGVGWLATDFKDSYKPSLRTGPASDHVTSASFAQMIIDFFVLSIHD